MFLLATLEIFCGAKMHGIYFRPWTLLRELTTLPQTPVFSIALDARDISTLPHSIDDGPTPSIDSALTCLPFCMH